MYSNRHTILFNIMESGAMVYLKNIRSCLARYCSLNMFDGEMFTDIFKVIFAEEKNLQK